jgi:hypothetical protein
MKSYILHYGGTIHRSDGYYWCFATQEWTQYPKTMTGIKLSLGEIIKYANTYPDYYNPKMII